MISALFKKNSGCSVDISRRLRVELEVSWNTARSQENTTWPDEGPGGGGRGKGVSFGNKIERA